MLFDILNIYHTFLTLSEIFLYLTQIYLCTTIFKKKLQADMKFKLILNLSCFVFHQVYQC